MTKPPILDLSAVPLDDLLSGLGDRNFRKQSAVELWVNTAGYYPGTTPTKASDLYEIFADWYRVRPELATYPMPTPQEFGLEMGSRFPKVRKRTGNYYLISRESVPYIPPSLETGGGGNPGGADTRGPGRKPRKKDK